MRTDAARQEALATVRRTPGYRDVQAALAAGGGAVWVDGLWGGAAGLFLAALASDTARVVAAVAPGTEEAEALAGDMASFLPPDTPPLVYPLGAGPAPGGARVFQDPLPGETYDALRILTAWASAAPPACAIPAAALLAEAPRPEPLAEGLVTLSVGRALPPETLLSALARAGSPLERTARVEGPFQYARRGGIVDCFLPPHPLPLRIEWDGDTIHSLRFFDPLTQESTETVTETVLSLVPEAAPRGPVLAHLPSSALVALLDPPEIQHRVTTLSRARGATDPDATWRAAWRTLASFTRVEISAGPGGGAADRAFAIQARSLDRFAGPLSHKMDILARFARANAPFHLFVRSDAEAERFRRLSADHGVVWGEALRIRRGRLSRGFELPPRNDAPGLVCVSFDEILDVRRLPRAVLPQAVRRAARPVEDLAQLAPGDVVVHEREGIAIYRGLARLARGGAEREYLKLEFAEHSILFVPTDEIGLVSRYVGAGAERPAPSRLGGAGWKRAKRVAAAATEAFAAEYLRIQALRAAHPAPPLAYDPAFAAAFDAAFPYPPTPDQEKAAAEIERDLAGARPMDRLLTGDVGFGKTEIAMRAAFRAVAAGRQVAVLAPTTVLALQHAKTFRERFAGFPVSIEMVSRLRKPAEQRQILAAARAGRVDIVIGTHRLLSRDVAFADLGLLIVDEEQKFGVAHKQRLKGMRAALHVLSLSATPIPRTLHEALLGIKEISSLATPPLDRRAIQTRVLRFAETLVRDAVRAELAREGQVFFVHNRIGGLERLRRMLARLVPEARVAVGHGRLPAAALERAMLDLAERRIDVLLSTTIVESGLDFPNVNTLIVNDAHLYGLAELHQLRGRVGRYKRQAFAYLMVPPDRPVPQAALRRLKAIEEFSDLGAGFQVALADLEIRGAGNLLGPEQSGHIAAVGYDLYCRLLEEAGRRLRGEPAAARREPAAVRLAGDAYLPDGYISPPEEKFALYRRLARAESAADVAAVERTLADRFGPPPAPAARLLLAARLRVLATAVGLLAIEERGDRVDLVAPPDLDVRAFLPEARPAGEGRWRLSRAASWTAALHAGLHRAVTSARGPSRG